MIEAAESLSDAVGLAAACRALGVPRSTVYRARKPATEPAPRPTPPRALSASEKTQVRDVLNSERFWDEILSNVVDRRDISGECLGSEYEQLL